MSHEAEQIKPSERNECFFSKFVIFSVITSSPLSMSEIRLAGVCFWRSERRFYSSPNKSGNYERAAN